MECLIITDLIQYETYWRSYCKSFSNSSVHRIGKRNNIRVIHSLVGEVCPIIIARFQPKREVKFSVTKIIVTLSWMHSMTLKFFLRTHRTHLKVFVHWIENWINWWIAQNLFFFIAIVIYLNDRNACRLKERRVHKTHTNLWIVEKLRLPVIFVGLIKSIQFVFFWFFFVWIFHMICGGNYRTIEYWNRVWHKSVVPFDFNVDIQVSDGFSLQKFLIFF